MNQETEKPIPPWLLKHVRWILVLVILLVLGLVTVIRNLPKSEVDILLTRAELERDLRQRFPVERLHGLSLQVTVSEPELKDSAGESVFRVVCQGRFERRLSVEPPVLGRLTVSSPVLYDPAIGRFYFGEIFVEALDLGDPPEDLQEQAELAVARIFEDNWNGWNLYRVPDSLVDRRPGRFVMEKVAWEEDGLRLVLKLAPPDPQD